jgi:tetratricopeptide (TPR) repeat protein
MYNTFNAFYTVINNTEYGSFDKDDKETINTIYSDIGQLAEKELTIDSLSGDEKETVTYDKAAVLFSQFMFAYSYNDFDKAYECMTELWQTYPEFVQMFGYEYAVIEIQSGNFKNAIRIADAVKANNAEDAYPYVVYSYTERMQGDYEKAIKKADEGLLIDKTNSDLYRQKGIALMLNGELKEAVEVFETGLGYSEYAVLYYTYLVALNELGDTEKIEEVQGVLKDSGLETPERVQKYLDGKISCKQLFTEGTGDIE